MQNKIEIQSKEDKNKILVAGFQIFCDAPKKDMLKKAESYMQEAIIKYPGIDLFVLPEQFYEMDCYEFSEDSKGEETNGVFKKWVSECAKKFHVNIVAGTYSVKDDIELNSKEKFNNIEDKNGKKQRFKNRCLIADRNGCIVGFYDKIHLFDAFGVKESDIFEAGDELGIFDLDIGKIGVWICYDSRFPEVARSLAQSGVDLFCVPAAFYSPNTDQWDILLKSAAICNITPVVAVNQYGALPNGKSLFGRSRIIDSKGIITAGASDKEGYFIGEIDKNYTMQCRKANPEKQNRRPDLYGKWYKMYTK